MIKLEYKFRAYSNDWYLLLQMLICALVLLWVQTIEQHLLLLLISYIDFIIVEFKLDLKRIFKVMLYIIPSIISFALAAFIFAVDKQSLNTQINNSFYLSVHFGTIIFISLLYGGNIKFNNLINYLLKFRFIPIFFVYTLIMIDITIKFILQDWKKIFISYKSRKYKIYKIYKPILLLVLNSIHYAKEMSINVLVRGLDFSSDKHNYHQAKLNYFSQVIPYLNTTASLQWWHYFVLLTPLLVLLF